MSIKFENKKHIIQYFEKGSKKKNEWKIGTEHEKFLYDVDNFKPIKYNGKKSIISLFNEFQKNGWEKILENNQPVALKRSGSTISLEPRCQIELSGAPVKTLHQTCMQAKKYLDELKKICDKKKIGIFGLGYYPTKFEKMNGWVPKKRYAIMKKKMIKNGTMGLEMMSSTCTIQTNLDYSSERDMFKKMRVGFALQPFITAIFANSPFVNSKKSKFLSYRSYIWSHTDKKRCGIIPSVFSKNFTFEEYVFYLLKVPMYFVVRNNKYLDARNQCFGDFLKGKLKILPKQLPGIKDLENHITTIFTDVRLKQYIEMRGADGGPWSRICALPAFWVGLLYNKEVLDQVFSLVKEWKYEEIFKLNNDVQKLGLQSKLRGKKIQNIFPTLLELSKKGLQKRKMLSKKKENEEHFLNPLFEIIEKGITPAEELIKKYFNKKKRKFNRIFFDNSY